MHPYQHIFLHRGPSRVFWFLLGAGAATWWHHAAPLRDHRAQYFPCLRPPHAAPDRIAVGASQQRGWEHGDLQKRAGDTVTDLSESTLDSIISGAESLKAKLTQIRTERERLEAEKNAVQPVV